MMNKTLITKFFQALGLHPIVGFGMFAVDQILFAGEAASAGTSLLLSIPVGLALIIPSAIVQKTRFGDSWQAAWFKGILVGVLTAIPTSLMSMIPLLGGIAGLAKWLESRQIN